MAEGAPPTVRQLRQVLLWPLRLIPVAQSRKAPWEILRDMGDASPWREVVDEYTGESGDFHERHYQEFTAFLPYVQRFLYGEGRASRQSNDPRTGSPMRVFRRRDIAQVRVLARPGDTPLVLDIVHADLYFFFDVDLVLLNLEVSARDLPLRAAQEQLYRFGRAYPGGWDDDGRAQHCAQSVEWLDAQGRVLAASDAQERELFLAHVCEHRAPRVAAHWAFMMQPLVSDHSGEPGPLRFRQIEYYRMPVMGYLALDDPQALSRADFLALGTVTGATDPTLTNTQGWLADFERSHCYDRFWGPGGAAPFTRYLCSGHSLMVVGGAQSHFFACRDRGVLAQFRHQHFLLFLIAHFQKAALLMYSDRLVEALRSLEIGNPDSVRAFKRAIRASFEGFLRFTHRYWFHEISDQAQVKALWHLTSRHLEIDPLYEEVKSRIADMSMYLEGDGLRRQANTIVRLTVVTIFGLIGTVTSGFLGMNLINEGDAPLAKKLVYFLAVFIPTIWLTFYTMAKSKRLSDFLDALSDERLSVWQKTKVLAAVWRPGTVERD
ncbi:hypothetical protein I5803_18180 [Caenimonas sp. DR4.4]|uniref:CorA-like Mg2+ transporter protein n=2 Tax=Caenimonas aquaedulcis TaxID=2793270 RepID=A0A931H790_9BURK|nr:hypothetical protein [Caenimonas aquaedulcis]